MKILVAMVMLYCSFHETLVSTYLIAVIVAIMGTKKNAAGREKTFVKHKGKSNNQHGG